MKCISWNVNGLRACLGKGFQSYFNLMDADFFCLQETKLQEGQVSLPLPGYSLTAFLNGKIKVFEYRKPFAFGNVRFFKLRNGKNVTHYAEPPQFLI